MHRNSRYLLLTCLASTLACSQTRMSSEETVATIGSSGGFLKSADGKLLLEFPAGVFASNTSVKIATDRGTIRGDLTGPIYRFSPSGVQFSSDVKVTVSVSALPPEGEDYFVANTDGAEPALLEDTVFDESTMTVSVGLRHFSSYGVFHRPGRCRALSCGDSCGQVGRIPLFCNARHRCVPARVLPDDTVIPPSCGAGQDGGPVGVDVPFSEVDADIFGGEDGGPLDPGDGGGQSGSVCSRPVGADAGVDFRGFFTEQEPNDDQASAQPLPWDSQCIVVTMQGTATNTDPDFYSFVVPPGTIANVRGITHSDRDALGICARGLDTTLELLDPAGNTLASDDNFLGGTSCSEINAGANIGAAHLPSGTYSFAVRLKGTTTAYFFSMQLELLPEGSGPDASIIPGEDAGPFIEPDASIIPGEDGGPFIGPDASIIPGEDGGPFIGPDGGVSFVDASSGSADAGRR